MLSKNFKLLFIRIKHLLFPVFIIGFAITSFILQVQAQSPVGVKTDLALYPEGAVPALPRAGSKLTDSTFGTQIMRVTDEADGPAFGTAYSYWSTFNLNSTRLLAQSESGSANLYEFDPVQFKLGAMQQMIFPSGAGYTTCEDAVWSGSDPDILFIHKGAAIYAFNAKLRTYTGSWDLSSQFPPGVYMVQMSMSRNDDIFAFTLKNADYSVGGYAVWQRSTNRVIYSERTSILDEVQIDKTGRYLVVKTGQSGAGVIEVKIVDLQTAAVTNLTDNQPDFSPGHSDNGMSGVVGADNWMNRLTYRNLATPHDLRTVLSFGSNWDVNFHVSLLGDDENWALVSFYGAMAGAFNGELALVATDGSQRVRRFAHHYSQYKVYQDAPRANLSRDGRYAAFTSNWGGSSRRDLFIAQIPSSDTAPIANVIPPPAPPPIAVTPIAVTPQPGASSSAAVNFEAVAGFGGTGNYLNKLPAPYYASADAAGVLSGDGWFSYKYNPLNNGAGIAVLLDDGSSNFGVINQGRYAEVRLNGVYLTDFPLDLNKTIKIERAGGLLKVWQDAALRYSQPAGNLLGAAKFKIKCGGEAASAGLGINSASSSLAAPAAAPVIAPAGYNPPPPVSNAVFQKPAGFSLNGTRDLNKLPAPYYASAETAGTLSGDGWFSYKYNSINGGAGIAVSLEDGRHSFAVVNQGRYLEMRLDGIYQADFLLDLSKTIKIEKAGNLLRVWEDSTLRYSQPIGNLFGAAKFKVNCGGEANAANLGIKGAVFAANGIIF